MDPPPDASWLRPSLSGWLPPRTRRRRWRWRPPTHYPCRCLRHCLYRVMTPTRDPISNPPPPSPIASACGQGELRSGRPGEISIARFACPPRQDGQTMQAAAPRTVKTLPVLRNRLCDPTRLAGASSSFHSTPASFAKWKDKWDCPKVRPS